MKSVALGLLALVVLATAGPVHQKQKVLSRQKRQGDTGAGSFDFGSFDIGSFDVGSFDFGSFDNSALGSFGDMMGSMASSMLEQGFGGSGFDSSQLENLDGEQIFNQMGTQFSNMVSQFANNIPDPLTDPAGFANYADTMANQFGGLGAVGDAIIDNMFKDKLSSGLSDIGLSEFADGAIDPDFLLDTMSDEAWTMMSSVGQHKEMFNVAGMTSDDFVTLMDIAGNTDPTALGAFVQITNDTSLLTPTLMEAIPIELFAALDPSVLTMLANNMTGEQLAYACAGLMYGDAWTAEYLMGYLDCTSYYMSADVVMDEETRMAMVEAKRGQKSMDQWSDSEWNSMASFAGGMDPADFDYMSNTAIMNNIGTFAGQVGSMEDDQLYALLDNIEDAFSGDFGNMDASTFGQMSSMIDSFDIEDIEAISPATKFAALDNFIGIEMDDEMAAEFADDILDLMPSYDQWGPSDFGKCIDFIKYDEEAFNQIPIATMASSLDTIGLFQFDETEASNIADAFMADATYGEPTNWNSSMIKNAGSLMAGFSPTFVDGMNAADLSTAFASMNASVRDKLDFPRPTARSVIEKMVSNSGGAANLNVSLLGPLSKAMTSADIASLPTNVAQLSVIKEMAKGYNDMDQATRRAVVDLATAGPGGLNAVFTDLGPFFKDLSLEEIDALPYATVSPKSPPTDPLNLDVTPAQTRRGWKNFVASFGKPSAAPGNWTIKMWKFMGPVVCGIPCESINKLPLSNKFPSVLNLFTKQEKKTKGCLNDAQMTCMAKRVRQFYFKNNSMELDFTRLTKRNIQKTAYYMASMNITDLNSLNISVCQTTLNNIGKFELNMIPRSALVKLKNYLLNCTGKAASGQPITLKELRSVGDLQCGIELSDVGNFETKVYKNAVGKMLERCPFMPVNVQDAMMERMMQANNISYNDFNISESKLIKLGGGILALNDSMLAKVPNSVMSKALPRIKKIVKAKTTKEATRANNGLSLDVSTDDQSTMTTRMQQFYTKAAEAVASQREKLTSGSTASSRRKRSTYSSLTCADIRKMGDGATSLTTAQLNLASTEWSSCYGTLGTITGWSTAQKEQLATTAKTHWGAVNTWATSKTTQIGTIAQGLSTSDLSAITYTNDIVSAFGRYSGWSSTQSAAVYTAWAATKSSALTTSDLQSLGEIACGATTSQIGGITGAAYKGAASQIGSLTCHTESQMQAWATIAKTSAAYGAVSTWDASTIAAVGTVLGGLSASEISQLSSTQIEAISSATISSMPTSAFAGFTATQLGYMTTTQVRSISSSQAASLSADAQSTLNSNSNFVTSNNNSGATTINVSFGLLMAVAFSFVL